MQMLKDPFAAAALSRRSFIVASAAAAGGLSLGFHVPAFAQAGPVRNELPEVNA